jgi:hypothetical protein
MPDLPERLKLFRGAEIYGSVLISERGIYAASPFKAIGALKRAKARAPSANQDIAKFNSGKWRRFAPSCLPVNLWM